MRPFLRSLTKSPLDKYWMATQIKTRIPNYATVYVDPSFSSDIFIYMKEWESMIVRPETQYEYRLLHAIINFGVDQINELVSLFSNKNAFTFETRYRPRILTSISDVELIAHAISTSQVTRVQYYGISRYRLRMKREIQVEKSIASVLRLQRILHNTNLSIVPPKHRFPMRHVERTDMIILNMDTIPREVFTTYMDPLSIKGMHVMLIGGMDARAMCNAQEYNVDKYTRRRGPDAYIVRNYQV